jgi:sulfofructose kinase
MSSAESSRDRRGDDTIAPRILCTGIIVLDEVFRVQEFPKADSKVEAEGFFVVNGGCAPNAAVAIARLGGRAALAGPLGGPAGEDDNGDRVLAALRRERVDTSACQRVAGLATALSAIFIDARGDRTIVTYRDHRIAAVTPDDPDALAATADLVLADNRYPEFVRPICEAARRRNVRVVLDGDKPTLVDDSLFRTASHVIFSAECLAATTDRSDLAEGLKIMAQHTDAFLAVSNGPNDILFLDGGHFHRVPVFAIRAIDTLGAGDALHGGFALALAEGRSEAEALRFGAAVAGIKCTRFGGSAGAPTRAEVEALLAGQTPHSAHSHDNGNQAAGPSLAQVPTDEGG